MSIEYVPPRLTELTTIERKENLPPTIYALCFPPFGIKFEERLSLLTEPKQVFTQIAEGACVLLNRDGSIIHRREGGFTEGEIENELVAIAVPWGDWFTFNDILIFCPDGKKPHLTDVDGKDKIFEIIQQYADYCLQKNGNFVLGENVTMAHIHDCVGRKGGQTVMFVHAHAGSLDTQIVNRPIEQIMADRSVVTIGSNNIPSKVASSHLYYSLSTDSLLSQLGQCSLYGDNMGVVLEFPNLDSNFLTSTQYQAMFKNLSLMIHGTLDIMYKKIFNGQLSDLVDIITSNNLTPEEKLQAYNKHLSEHIKNEDEILSTEEGKELLRLYKENKLRFGWPYALTAVPNGRGGLTVRLFISLDLFDNTQDMGPIEAMGCRLNRVKIDDVNIAKRLSEEKCAEVLQALP